MTERQGVIVPPINFAMILPGVYRSGCPTKENIGFLKKLSLRCLLYIGTETLPADYKRISLENIVGETMVIGMEGNKEPFTTMSLEDVTNVLGIILDRSYHPILIHSMKGRHREGVVVGCLRRLQGLSLVSIYDEYDRYCGRYKAQPMDKRYIEVFTPCRKFPRNCLPEGWLHTFVLDTYVADEGGVANSGGASADDAPGGRAAAGTAKGGAVEGPRPCGGARQKGGAEVLPPSHVHPHHHHTGGPGGGGGSAQSASQ